MNVNDIVTYTATLLDFDYPPQQKDRYFLVLFRELLRKNRMVAEQQGIGLESNLMPAYPHHIMFALEHGDVETATEWFREQGLVA
jgi:hypothetical protein